MESEVAVLREQNAVYAADFQLERADRERSQSRVIELEEQLAAAGQRIADLEDEKQCFLTTVPTTRHHVSLLSHKCFNLWMQVFIVFCLMTWTESTIPLLC